VVSSVLEQYRVADFLEWDEKKQLILNPYFQRGLVWPPAARSYLIDSVLQRLPIPKVFMRTQVDVHTKRSIREVVDGQQRLRAIIDFGSDKLTLGPRAGQFKGLKYSTLEPEFQNVFLSYPIAVDQLINASDNDVLEVFSRLNSYTVPVNAPELRHAKYQSEFKWAVHEATIRWATLWVDLHVLSNRDRIRLLADSLMAEMFAILLFGLADGGQKRIDVLYGRMEREKFDREACDSKLDGVLRELLSIASPVIQGTAVAGAPHFLMLFSAAAHILFGLPRGEFDKELPERDGFSTVDQIQENLQKIDEVIRQDEPPKETNALDFWKASKASTQRIEAYAKEP
jgi:hypothetical protein